MNGSTTKKVTTAIAVIGSIAAITTVVAVWRRKSNSFEAKASKLAHICEDAVHELERRIGDHNSIVRQTA